MQKTVVELFAGVGGFHKGLKDADSEFNIIWANQWEPGKNAQYAFDCYYERFKESTQCVNNDIAEVKDDIPKHTLLVGGFPCQDYSVAATGAKGIEGRKGVLWWEIRHILEKKEPPFVLLENVDRLLKSPASQRGRDFGVMLACFAKLDYSVEWRVINAADYGFAQRRRRIFIFACKNDTKYGNKQATQPLLNIINKEGLFAKAFPIETVPNAIPMSFEYEDVKRISDEFKYQFSNSGVMRGGNILSVHTTPIYTNPTTLSEIIQSGVEERYYLGEDKTIWEKMKGSKSIDRISKTGHKYKFSEGAIAFPDPLDRPARTMLTSEASKNRSTHVIIDPETNRYRLLTPVECEKLNGFPGNWTEKIPHNFRYFVMGNALVVGIVEKLGKQISMIIEKE